MYSVYTYIDTRTHIHIHCLHTHTHTHTHTHIYIHRASQRFSGKESVCEAGASGDAYSIPGEDPLEEDIATHSSILSWRIPMDRGAWWATVHEVTKTWTWLKRLSMHAWIYRHEHIHIYTLPAKTIVKELNSIHPVIIKKINIDREMQVIFGKYYLWGKYTKY